MNLERLVPTDPKVFAEVLTKSYKFVKPQVLQLSLGRVLGNGIIMSEGDEHKYQRKILLKAFYPRQLRSFSTLFLDKSKDMTKFITQVIKDSGFGDPVIDINSWSSRCTLDIIGKTTAGIDFNAMADPANDLLEAYDKVFLLGPSKRRPWLNALNMFMPLWFLKRLPSKSLKDITASSNLIQSFCDDVIRQKRAEPKKGAEMHSDMLSIIMEEGSLSNDELKHQLMNLIAAGHETTSAAVSWAAYELSRRPEVAKRLRTAIREAIPSFESITTQAIENIPYLSNFCNEVLRFHPSIPVTIRESATDETINGQFVPKGTKVMLFMAFMNLSEELWGPDAESFDPDRWGRSDDSSPPKHASLTFLMGPRSCLGQKFSILELKTIITCLAGMFAFEEETKDMVINIEGKITQRPVRHGKLPLKTSIVPGW
ncbi:hypothetical protein ABW20_dc0101929 [Dactylellina cionopaga]|nr:hypothetical protein ABW20_dc0101929 [Dactylellina cionopaga]